MEVKCSVHTTQYCGVQGRSASKFTVKVQYFVCLCSPTSKGAYTPAESSRVQSSPVRLTKTQQWPCGLLKMAATAVHTHQRSRVESSRVESHKCQESWSQIICLDAACSIFVSQTLAIGRDGCYLEQEMDVEKLILLVKDHEAIYDASRCEHRNRVLHWWWCS